MAHDCFRVVVDAAAGEEPGTMTPLVLKFMFTNPFATYKLANRARAMMRRPLYVEYIYISSVFHKLAPSDIQIRT